MLKTKTGIALAALVLLTACSGVSSGPNGGSGNNPPPAPDTISGTVTFNGAPLAGATVTDFITNTNSVFQTATTDANGRYTFTGMQTTGNVPGEYQIFVNKAGYGFYPSVASGAKVTRADYTGQFEGNGVTDIAIYFTVIDFVALPDGSVTGANFAAYNGTNPLVALAATGQQTSYAPGDDASLHRGAPWIASTRFTDNQDGTIADSLTGLVWLKNAGCFSPTTWADAIAEVNQIASGSCGLTDGSTAGQWRMPNLNELESLIDVSQTNPALPPGNPFLNVSPAIYWSSTSYFGGQDGSPQAWTIRLTDGRYMNDSNANVKATANNAVWAVKGTGSGGGTVQLASTGFYVSYVAGDDGMYQTGVPLTSPRFIDNANGTITDTMTGLVWLKRADCITGQWSDAVAAVNALANGQCGLSDGSQAGQWRMPNRNELQSLSDRMETNHADYFNSTYVWKSSGALYQSPIFTNFEVSHYYWTSTTYAADPTEAWATYSCDYGVYDIGKTNVEYALAVR